MSCCPTQQAEHGLPSHRNYPPLDIGSLRLVVLMRLPTETASSSGEGSSPMGLNFHSLKRCRRLFGGVGGPSSWCPLSRLRGLTRACTMCKTPAPWHHAWHATMQYQYHSVPDVDIGNLKHWVPVCGRVIKLVVQGTAARGLGPDVTAACSAGHCCCAYCVK